MLDTCVRSSSSGWELQTNKHPPYKYILIYLHIYTHSHIYARTHAHLYTHVCAYANVFSFLTFFLYEHQVKKI